MVLDGQLTAFRGRHLKHVRFSYVYLDATYCKARVEHQRSATTTWGWSRPSARSCSARPTSSAASALPNPSRRVRQRTAQRVKIRQGDW